jgi:hypothetical protein
VIVLLKKIIYLLIFAVISFSIYAVFVNVYSDYQYEQDVNSLRSEYSLNDNFSITNPNSISIPAPLRRYVQYSLPANRNLSTYVRVEYSGKYRQEKYGEMYDFNVKTVYNLKNGEFVSEWTIYENRIIFNKLKEVLLDDKVIYQYKKLGVKAEKVVEGEKARLFLQSRMMIDAVYFPYYYLGNSNLRLNPAGGNRTLVEFMSGSEKINFTFEFNEDNSLESISSSQFVFGSDRAALSASYDNYINFNGFMIPNSIVVKIENNFDEYILYEAQLDNINYQ